MVMACNFHFYEIGRLHAAIAAVASSWVVFACFYLWEIVGAVGGQHCQQITSTNSQYVICRLIAAAMWRATAASLLHCGQSMLMAGAATAGEEKHTSLQPQKMAWVFVAACDAASNASNVGLLLHRAGAAELQQHRAMLRGIQLLPHRRFGY